MEKETKNPVAGNGGGTVKVIVNREHIKKRILHEVSLIKRLEIKNALELLPTDTDLITVLENKKWCEEMQGRTMGTGVDPEDFKWGGFFYMCNNAIKENEVRPIILEINKGSKFIFDKEQVNNLGIFVERLIILKDDDIFTV